MKKILTLALLGSTLVLTACGGSSDSSGSKASSDKAQQLDGYWKADCKYDNETSSYKSYIVSLTKVNKNKVLREESYRGNYHNSKCTGKPYSYSEQSSVTINIDEFEERGSVISNDTFKAVFPDGDVEMYRRISASEFQRLKNSV
ncbi:MAG: hypothetical protein KGV51_08120 [Moraxellaceae bacterium]|nr:hypothetical protein [Moraxellaceae bacterium]